MTVPEKLGREAYKNYKRIEENPFNKSTDPVSYWKWREGWLKAYTEDMNT